MDEQFAEAKKLAKLLNCDELSSFTDLVLLVQRFAGEGSTNRVQLVLQQFLDDRDKPVSINVLQKEAIALHEIFPNKSVIDIINCLREFQYEDTRVRIVVRKLLKEGNGNRHIKRPSSFLEEASVEKKPKIVSTAEASNSGVTKASTSKETDVISPNNSESLKNTPSLDSQATIIYPLENNAFMLNPITYNENSDELVEQSLHSSEKALTLENTESNNKDEPETEGIKIEYPSSTVQDLQMEKDNNKRESSHHDPLDLFKESQPLKKVRFCDDKSDTTQKKLKRSYSEPISSLDRQPAKTILKNYNHLHDDMSIRTAPRINLIPKSLNSNVNYCIFPFPTHSRPGPFFNQANAPASASLSTNLLKLLPPSGNPPKEFMNFIQNQTDTNSLEPTNLVLDKLDPPTSGSNSSGSNPGSPNAAEEDGDSNMSAAYEDGRFTNDNSDVDSALDVRLNESDSEGSSGICSDSESKRRKPRTIKSVIHKPSTVTQAAGAGPMMNVRFAAGMPSTSIANERHLQPPTRRTSERAANRKLILSAKEETEEKYDLYKHLQEMFTDIARATIKAVCDRYPVDKHTRPQDNIFNIIVSDLLVEQPSHSGTGKAARPTFVDGDVLIDNFTNAPPLPPNPNAQFNMSVSRRLLTKMPSATNAAANQFFEDLNEVLIDLSKKDNFDLEKATEELNQTIMEEDEEDEDEDEEDEVNNATIVDNTLVYPLMEMFPQACPNYIRRICVGKTNAPGILDNLISEILEQDDYPKRQKASSPEHKMEPEEQHEMLKQIFPDADPSYLQVHCDRLIDKPDDLKVFISNLLETRNYPTMKDYLRKQQISAQQKQYTTEFKVENFLELIPDPAAYFWDPKRKGAIVDDESVHYAVCFLRNLFCRISIRLIREIVKKHDRNFLAAYKELQKVNPQSYMKSKRGECPMPQLIHNIPLLQEIAYIEHCEEIEKYLKLKKVQEAEEKQAAKEAGLLQTCDCCFDDEVMPKDIYKCEKGCCFCKDCVRKGCEVAFGDGKLDFLCLNNCSSHFSLQTLQAVLNPKMFSKMALKKQVEEVKAAGISDLETCPFCDFMTIPAREDKLFRCLNPECMKESCRLCKEPSHLPLRCEEVEKEDDVKIRTYIENKMTEALLRKCYKCGMKFIKADGCNKMTCSCGALMCYVCNQPVKDYKHFNGPGGDRFDLCPLYNDTNNLHQEAVLKGAEAAKKELGVDKDPSTLKIDPTMDVQQHYNEIKKKNPVVVPPYPNPPPLVLPPAVLQPNYNPNHIPNHNPNHNPNHAFFQNAERQIARIRQLHHHRHLHQQQQNRRQREAQQRHHDMPHHRDEFF